jgi:hypothetical protein
MKERTATDLPARPLRHSRRNTLRKTRCKLCRMEILGVGADRQGSLQRLVLPVSVDRVGNHGLGSVVVERERDWMVRSFADRISAGESVRGQGISRMTDGSSSSAELRERTGTGRDVFRCRREDVLCRDGVSKGTKCRLLVVLAYLGVQLDGFRARRTGFVRRLTFQTPYLRKGLSTMPSLRSPGRSHPVSSLLLLANIIADPAESGVFTGYLCQVGLADHVGDLTCADSASERR